MPRQRREIIPGTVHHLISRIVNGEFRLHGPRERGECLRRVERAMRDFDWQALAYALMSNHLHWAKLAGHHPHSRFFESLNSGFATWLNDRDDRTGPVFAHRPRESVALSSKGVRQLIAYIHNNPVRAGVVASPEETDWTSHRVYIGLEPAPPWLSVDTGLRLCGFDVSAAGRKAFHEYVVSRSHLPRDESFDDDALVERRATVRELVGAPAEIGAVRFDEDHSEVSVFLPPIAAVHPVWQGDLRVVLDVVSRQTNVSVERMCSRERTPRVSHSRRLTVAVAHWELNRPLTEVAAALGITVGSASNLVRRYRGDWTAVRERAKAIATAIAGDYPQTCKLA